MTEEKKVEKMTEEKKEFYKKFLTVGMRKMGEIPAGVLEDPKMLKAMIGHETVVLSFLPDSLKTPQYFAASKPGRGRNVLVAMETTNVFIPPKMLEQMLEDFSVLTGYTYLKDEPKQFKKFSAKGKTSLALTFLLEKRSVPEYLKKYSEGYEDYSQEKLKEIKDKLIFSKSLDKIVDKSLIISGSSDFIDSDSKFKL